VAGVTHAMLFQSAPGASSPIIVKVIEAPSQTLGDVVIAAIGISGVLALGAAVFGLVLGAGFIALRSRRRRRQPANAPTDHQQLHLSG